MKTLKESLFDQDITSDELDKAMIRKWLKEYYIIHGGLSINTSSKTIDVLSGGYLFNVSVKYPVCKTMERLLPEGWKFGKISEGFSCENCYSLKSLEGAPDKVTGRFECSRCYNIESLEGAPEYAGEDFICRDCKSLKTLKGSPKTIQGAFICCGCDVLKSLKGLPNKIGGLFNCVACESLKSLEGIPKVIGGYFSCKDCPIDDYSILDKVKIEGMIYR